MHVNDFKMMESKATFHRVHEIRHPFYYVEFTLESANPLMNVGSLTRLNAFANACSRAKLSETLLHGVEPRPGCKSSQSKSLFESHLVYVDSKYLVLKNARISPAYQTLKSVLLEASGGGLHQLSNGLEVSYAPADIGKWTLRY